MDIVDPLLSESISNLTGLVISVIKTTLNFKSELAQLQDTLNKITHLINDVDKLNQILDQPSDMFTEPIKNADKLVRKCEKIKWNVIKRFFHSMKLKDANDKLLRLFQLEVQADQVRDIKQLRVQVETLSLDVKHIGHTLSNTSCSSRSYHIIQMGSERRELGWRVPPLDAGVVGFDEPLEKLKAKVLYDDMMDIDESSVLVVAAAGGCGKTTLVTMLCHDHQVKGKFGENVFFVTVSESPNFKVIVNNLFNLQPSNQPIPFQTDEDAKNKLGNFLHENVSSPVLLVLDDVWDHTFIDNFPLNIKGCTILVTSRTPFSQFDVFEFDPLSEKDANILFRNSAFTKSKKRPRTTIKEYLVEQMVICCKKHPLTLTVVGRSLNGKDESYWRFMQDSLADGNSVLDLNEQVRNRLERSVITLSEELKECYMDFGLFPEDQRIPATALVDMWAHLYNHDHEGQETFNKILVLSYKNLIKLVATSLNKDSDTTVNYCDQQFLKQHDMLRELAIHLSSKPEVPIAHRKRLIINAPGEDLPASIWKLQEPMRACILSISTGELFSSRWCDLKVPEVEVMVLNLKSKTYTLPHFMKGMQKLKVLNVTNYGLYPSYIENSDPLGCLLNLSWIRLEFVSVSSLNASILALGNLQKVSLIMCKIGDAFETKLGTSVWPKLVELEMDYCQDLVRFPELLCDSVHLKTLSITNCNELCEISEEFGKLINLENLSLQSCVKLEKLPRSITRLKKLRILDISDCLSLCELPEEMGKLVGLRAIHMKGCTGIGELPSSIVELSHLNVLCSEDMCNQWSKFHNVTTEQVVEDREEILNKIIK
ncbi:putative disease resistance protein At5g66900 [Bidens hawaiensis]|uniref:putative disease resistance protein At5g66900 n=1 Tax=Bidens hawaiensis TaxID=980011 RepID=UPI004049A6D5